MNTYNIGGFIMVKIEKCTIKIKGKDYNFLKPTAVELIEIEDKSINPNGTINVKLFNDSVLKLVSAKLSADDLVEFKPQEVELSSGDKLSLPEVGYDKWTSVMEEMGTFSRIKLAKTAVASTGVSGEITLAGFTYQDIDALAMAYFGMYDVSEMTRVVDEVTTFCFS